jgi:outer membrane protein
MKKLALGAAIAALSIGIPGAALAQRNNNNASAAPIILIVDTEKVFNDCNACRTAAATLQQQAQAYNTRAQQLQAPLQNEGQAIQTAVNALNGRQPDAALQARINAFQGKETTASQELQSRQQTLRSTQANVQQQIGNALGPVIETLRNQRGALVVLSKNATLANAGNIEVTNDVLTALNAALTSVNVVPLPQQQQPAPAAQPQGR